MRRHLFVLIVLIGLTTSLALGGVASAGGFVLPKVVLTTPLSGQEEVPPADSDGSGFAILKLDTVGGEVCWWIFVRGIEVPALAAHIHEAAAGENGPIVVGLGPPAAVGQGFLELGFSRGCTQADPALVRRIAGSPSGFYVNVHNPPFPGGAVRGQL